MTDAIEKLIEAAEACLEYKPGWSTAMGASIAPARAEWERMREENESRGKVLQAAGKLAVDQLQEITRLRAELAAARAPMAVTGEAIDAACKAWFESDDFDDENRLGMDGALTAALPHLRPAPLPSEEAIARIIWKHITHGYIGEPSFVDDAARAILALLREGGRE